MQEITILSHALQYNDETAIIFYNQRKRVSKQGFPLIIGAFFTLFPAETYRKTSISAGYKIYFAIFAAD